MAAATAIDALAAYRAELGKRRILTPEVERDLALRWRAGESDAGRRLIEACLSYVMSIALEYRRWGTPLEDIVQQGNIGLLKAAERFDPERGVRLASFAGFWIRNEIRDYVTRNHRLVRLGSSKAERRAVRYYRRAFVKDPEVLAARTGLSEQRAHALMPMLAGPELCFDVPLHEGGYCPADSCQSAARSPEDEVCMADERARLSGALKTALAELSPREQQIVQRRLLAEDPETLEQLGTSFGVSRERVRQVEERTKQRLRARLQSLNAAPG